MKLGKMELPFADRGEAMGGLATGGPQFKLGHVPRGKSMRYPLDVLRKQEISKFEVQGGPVVLTTTTLAGLTEAECSWLEERLGGGLGHSNTPRLSRGRRRTRMTAWKPRLLSRVNTMFAENI